MVNTLRKPIFLKPAGKDYLWGGNRLNDDFAKNIPLSPLAETWECSTHPDGPSVVAAGEFAGQTLQAVLQQHPEFVGSHPLQAGLKAGELPLLIKLIDAKRDLSVQVHPDDDYAREHEAGQLGKTEMWYVIDAEPGAKLVYGLKEAVSGERLRQSISDGTVEQLLQQVMIKKNDLLFLEAGTIHAIGAGALIAEIQESSNLTYRLYDYQRRDKDGQLRPLHVDKALAVAKLAKTAEPRQPMRVLSYTPGCARELLCRCKYFEVHRMLVNTARIRQMVSFEVDEVSFRVLLCTEGCGTLTTADGDVKNIFSGDCIFFPAGAGMVKLHGRAQFLDIRG